MILAMGDIVETLIDSEQPIWIGPGHPDDTSFDGNIHPFVSAGTRGFVSGVSNGEVSVMIKDFRLAAADCFSPDAVEFCYKHRQLRRVE